MSAIDRLDDMSAEQFVLLQIPLCVLTVFACAVIDSFGAAIFHECYAFLSAVGELYLGLAVSFFDFFRKDILLVFAGVHFYSMLIRMESLRFDRWQMGYFDERNKPNVKPVAPAKEMSWVQAYTLFGVFTLLFVICFDAFILLGAEIRINSSEWTNTVLVVAFIFLFIVAAVLHGQIFFRKAYHYWLARKKARLTKRHKEFMDELSALERAWFTDEEVKEVVEEHKKKIKKKSDEAAAELHWLERNGVN